MSENTKTPRIRFKGFTDAWEQRKAKTLFISYAEKGYPELPVLSATQDKGMVYRDDTGKNIFHDKNNEISYKRVQPGQFVIHLRSFQGGFAHSNILGITSPAYTIFGFKDDEKQCDLYWKYVFCSSEFVKRLETVTYGIRDGRSISYDEFLTMKFIVPKYEEQVQIASILIEIDNLITLHQRKQNKQFLGVQPEKCCEKIANSWEQRKVNEVVASVDTGRSHFQAKMSGKYEILGSTAVIGYDDEFDYQGEFLLAARVGANAGTLYRHSGKVKISDNTVFLQGNNLDFMYYALFNYDLKKLSFGTGQPLVKASELKKLSLILPSSEKEKKYVGRFFEQIDNLITLHQCKYFLCSYKNVIFHLQQSISKMTNSWEQRKFKESVEIERGGSPRPIDDYITNEPNGLNWIKIGDAPEQGNVIVKTAEKIKPSGLSKTRQVQIGDLILSNSMSFGKPYIMGINGCIHDGWLLIRDVQGAFDLIFLCQLLGTDQMLKQYKARAAGSTVNNLNKEVVGNTLITVPTKCEQHKLGGLFQKIDNLITLHQRKFKDFHGGFL